MIKEQFIRSALIFGESAIDRLTNAHVAVFGLGGVGSYVVESLARSGIGTFTLIDNDMVCMSNLNRQLIATHETIGQYKTEVTKKRILSIQPEAVIYTKQCFFLPELADQFTFSDYTYVVDAIDTVTAKIELVLRCQKEAIPIISSMGTGNKIEPTKLEVADIYETSICPLAKVMRRELRKRGVSHLKVVYSKELPKRQSIFTESELTALDGVSNKKENQMPKKRQTPGSTAFVPSAAGLIIASEVIKDILHV